MSEQSPIAAAADLHSTDPNTRVQAVWTLRHLGDEGDAQAIALLGEAMADPHLRVRAAAVLALGHFRSGQDLLTRHLNGDASSHVRVLCAGMLCFPEYAPAVDAFVQALGDEKDTVVGIVCSQLGYVGAMEAIPAIRALLEHHSWRVRRHACEALYRLEAVDQQVVNTLEALASEASTHDEWVLHCRQSGNETAREMGQDNWTTSELLEAVRQALPHQSSGD